MKTPQRIAYMDEAAALLKDWGKSHDKKIKITLQRRSTTIRNYRNGQT